MPILQTTFDDPDVGRGSDYFEVDKTKKRIAFIPFFKPLSECQVSPELTAKAASGDNDAIDELQFMVKFNQLMEQGMNRKPLPTVKKMVQNGIEGYRYCRMDNHANHYDESVKYYLCKAREYEKLGREPECCKKAKKEIIAKKQEWRGPQVMYAFVICHYKTDVEGNVLTIDPTAQRVIDANNKLDFSYSLMPWAINNAKIKGLEQSKYKFPLISCDYEVWTQTVGRSERVTFSPCPPPALWLSKGPVFEDRIMREALAFWENDVPRQLGKNLSIEQIDEMCLGTGVQQSKPRTEKHFSNLI